MVERNVAFFDHHSKEDCTPKQIRLQLQKIFPKAKILEDKKQISKLIVREWQKENHQDKPEISSTTPKLEIRTFPLEKQYFIDKFADNVLRYGKEYESYFKKTSRLDPYFGFLHLSFTTEGSYYQKKLFEMVNPQFKGKLFEEDLSGFIYGYPPHRITGQYQAAGILPWARDSNSGEIFILLGFQNNPHTRFHFLESKLNSEIHPETTALRAFYRQTAHLFEKQIFEFAAALFQPEGTKVWANQSVTFLLQIPYVKDITAEFQNSKKQFRKKEGDIEDSLLRCDYIEWVSPSTFHEDLIGQESLPLSAFRNVYGVKEYFLSLSDPGNHASDPVVFPKYKTYQYPPNRTYLFNTDTVNTFPSVFI